MSGPSGRLREVCVLTFLLVFAAVFRSDAGSAPATPSSQRQYAQSRELAAAAQDEDTPRRPRRKSRPTPEEAREKSEAAKRAALEELQKKFPSLNKGSPSAGAPSQGGAPGANRRTPSGPGEGLNAGGGNMARSGTRLGDGIYRLDINSDGSCTIPIFPIQQGQAIRGPSEYPPENYVLRHATETMGLRSAESDGACQFEMALPLPLDIGEYRRLESTVWLRTENLKIVEAEVRTVQQEYNTFLFFKLRTEGNGQGDKAIYFIRGSWMMVPALFARPKTFIPSQVNPWAVELQAEAARRARIDIAAAQSVGLSPLDKQFQQCARCAIDLRNVSEKRLLVVAGHHFSDEQIGPKSLIEGLHAWNMSVAGNIIVDGTGGNYVGPQGCNFFPTRIYPDCATINDPFSLNVGGGTILKTKMNTLCLGAFRGTFGKITSSMKVFFDAPEGWGADWNSPETQRREKIAQMTRLFQKEVAVRQRVNSAAQ